MTYTRRDPGGAPGDTLATTTDPTAIRLRAILAGRLDPFVTIDTRGVVQEASESVSSVFGWEPNELIGRNVNVLMGEPHRSRHDGFLARYRETGETHILDRTHELEVVKKDGTPLVCELSVSRLDVPGEPEPLFIESFRDVTERRKAEQALAVRERRLGVVLDHTFEFVALLSPEGRVLEVNRAALEAADREREEVIGRLFWEIPWWEQMEETRETVQRSVSAAARGEFVRFETTLRGAGGQSKTIDFSLRPVRDERGEIDLLVPVVRDVTVLKDAQRREMHMLKALATIGESASVLVHEIKNPITGIRLAIQAVADQLGEDTREILRGLEESLHKVERTMRRTLSFAKPLELRRAAIDVSRLLETVARRAHSELEPSATAVEIECEAELPQLEGDERQLEEAIWSLVKNALEALESAGRVRLSARRAGAHALEISVEDDGPGLPSYVLPNVFKPFYTTKEQGTGIGLALCKKIVDAHGGEIRAGRSDLGGAAFAICLPLA